MRRDKNVFALSNEALLTAINMRNAMDGEKRHGPDREGRQTATWPPEEDLGTSANPE